MASGSRLTYGTLTLHSSEILKFNFKRSFNISVMDTVSLLQITQPGNLTTVTFTIDTRITDNCSTKFTTWINKLAEKPLEALTFLGRSWGNYYLTDVDITSDQLDDAGDVLRMDMSLTLVGNQNF